MTAHEFDLAVRAVIGLAGCAVALVAIVADWRERRQLRRRGYTLDFGDAPLAARKAD